MINEVSKGMGWVQEGEDWIGAMCHAEKKLRLDLQAFTEGSEAEDSRPAMFTC